ncbi:MAG: 30S ribosomal protein S6 [Candidatus Atribacteria bacterium]|nr:30S ribosomal protein S6 [Candidatus Atribacteria bacterium]
MNQYELGMVLRSTLTEEEVNQLVEGVKSRIAELGGECTGTHLWGKRRLAHPIKKQTEGIYVFFNFLLSPQSVKELARTVQFIDSVLRHILVKDVKKTTVKEKKTVEDLITETNPEPQLEELELSHSETDDVQTPSE